MVVRVTTQVSSWEHEEYWMLTSVQACMMCTDHMYELMDNLLLHQPLLQYSSYYSILFIICTLKTAKQWNTQSNKRVIHEHMDQSTLRGNYTNIGQKSMNVAQPPDRSHHLYYILVINIVCVRTIFVWV